MRFYTSLSTVCTQTACKISDFSLIGKISLEFLVGKSVFLSPVEAFRDVKMEKGIFRKGEIKFSVAKSMLLRKYHIYLHLLIESEPRA